MIQSVPEGVAQSIMGYWCSPLREERDPALPVRQAQGLACLVHDHRIVGLEEGVGELGPDVGGLLPNEREGKFHAPLANAPYPARFHDMPTATAKRRSVKNEAIKLVRGLPATSSWDDLMYSSYVRQKIEAGLADIRAGQVHAHESVRKEFSLP